MLTFEPGTSQTLSKGCNQRAAIFPLWVKLCLPSLVPYQCFKGVYSRSRWPRDLRRRSAAARLLRLWVRIPPRAWMSVVSVVYFQAEASAVSWSLVQRSPTDCGASLCVISNPDEWGTPGPLGGCGAKIKQPCYTKCVTQDDHCHS